VDALAFRNTIPNVSACVFRKDALIAAGPGFAEFQSCGDWLLYAQILKHAKIAYIAKPLNAFRRHSGSSTRKRERSPEFLDELLRVREFICSNFPLHQRQLPLLKQFLDKDYRIEGFAKPSESPAFVEIEGRLAALAASRRRIGFITTNNGSYFGGSEMLWQEAALRLAGAGHDVAVLIKEWLPRPDFFETFDRAGIKMHFKERNGFDELIAFAPDLTIVSLGDQDEGTDYFKGLQQAGLPYAIVNQLTKEERFWPIRANKAADVKSGYLGAERVFFTCRNNHRVMEERLSCSLPSWDVHYNPFHIDRSLVPPFPPLDGGLKLALPAKLLFIHKGQDILVEVLKDEKWKARNLVINIYGIGPDRERLEQMARDYGVRNLVFHGRVPDIGEIWRDNHALILPSRMEGMPIMLISALLCARVPIVTNIGGHAEVVDDGVTGFLAATPSVEALDQALDRAYAARQDWEEIGRRARARVLTYLPDDPVGDFVQKILPLARRAAGAEPPGQDLKQSAPI
jgi:glycosyltransferase involved in cell wall biosynthesis